MQARSMGQTENGTNCSARLISMFSSIFCCCLRTNSSNNTEHGAYLERMRNSNNAEEIVWIHRDDIRNVDFASAFLDNENNISEETVVDSERGDEPSLSSKSANRL